MTLPRSLCLELPRFGRLFKLHSPDVSKSIALPVHGDANRAKWVLSCAPGYYCIGSLTARAPYRTGRVRQVPQEETRVSRVFLLLRSHGSTRPQSFSHHPEGHRVQVACRPR